MKRDCSILKHTRTWKRKIVPKGYFITDECISCGKCAQVCPQNAIATGSPSIIRQDIVSIAETALNIARCPPSGAIKDFRTEHTCLMI